MITPRHPRTALALLLSLIIGAAQAQGDAGGSAHATKTTPKREVIEAMFSERGPAADFEKAVASAKEQGADDEAVLEARFLYWVDRRDDNKLVELLPQFEARDAKFDVADSKIFAVREDWLSVIEYLRSLAALKKGDKEGFKKHIMEAFWLSPRKGDAFATHIERLRMEEAMKGLKVPMTAELESLKGGKTTLSTLAKDRKALLLHFWSPWSRECRDSMPDFKAVAMELGKNGIAVASLLEESDLSEDAKSVVDSLGAKPPGAWLKGDAAASLARTLRIQNLPAMVLLSTEGAVIYNGEPSDDELWSALKNIAPEIKRPQLEEK